jgi:hypothetical protein
MSRVNKQIFIFLNLLSLILIIIVFLAKGLGYSKSTIFFQGYTLRMFILASTLSTIGLLALSSAERIFNIYSLPNSLNALINCFKNGISVFFNGKRKDVIIIAIIFIAAMFEVFFYNNQLSLSNKVLPYILPEHNPLWETGSENIYVIFDRNYMHVPWVWILIKTINTISLYIPFITYQGIIFAMVITLYYCIFRLGMGIALAFIFTILIMGSSIQLDHLIPFWDKYYFRAPFVLSFILITGILIKDPVGPTGILFWAFLLGAILGLGLMIRPDLNVYAIPIILTILFLVPPSKIVNLKFKIMSIFLFITVTLLFFQTCPRCSLFQSRTSHALINATTTYEQETAGLKLPKYDWNYLFTEPYTSSLSYGQARVFNPSILYENYGPVDEYAKLLISNFPADILTKSYGVVLKIMEMPFSYLLHPVGINNEFILHLYILREKLLSLFSELGFWFCLGAVLLIGTKNLRKGMYLIIMIPPLMLLPAIIHIGYYSFYLEFISFWALGFLLNCLIVGCYSIWNKV